MKNIRGKHDIFGNLITQKRGLLALPILVLCAQEHRTITFQELGNAIGVSNPWRMGKVLGCINTTQLQFGKESRLGIWGNTLYHNNRHQEVRWTEWLDARATWTDLVGKLQDSPYRTRV